MQLGTKWIKWWWNKKREEKGVAKNRCEKVNCDRSRARSRHQMMMMLVIVIVIIIMIIIIRIVAVWSRYFKQRIVVARANDVLRKKRKESVARQTKWREMKKIKNQTGGRRRFETDEMNVIWWFAADPINKKKNKSWKRKKAKRCGNNWNE